MKIHRISIESIIYMACKTHGQSIDDTKVNCFSDLLGQVSDKSIRIILFVDAVESLYDNHYLSASILRNLSIMTNSSHHLLVLFGSTEESMSCLRTNHQFGFTLQSSSGWSSKLPSYHV